MSIAAAVGMVLAGLVLGSAVLAQNDAARHAADDSGGSFEVGGIDVDVVGKTASAARLAGWRIAQRKGWEMLAKRYGRDGAVSDGTLESVVSAIVVERELAGGNRYIARLGVEFSRARAGALLGIATAQARSSPMLLIPVIWSGGVGRVFEQRTPWLEAWARFRTGNSTVDYVRPSGTGPDALLMTTGQILRPGRGWWRAILAQYGATNVLIPIVHLSRLGPGGPVVGAFQARYGPDNRLLGSFSLKVSTPDAIPALLDAGTRRIDEVYQRALAGGMFQTDPGLAFRPPSAAATDVTADDAAATEEATPDATAAAIIVQVDTPNAGSVATAEASLRDIPGVRSATTSSLALGAISVMRVTYTGDAAALAAALEARGWRVARGNGAIRIERPAAGSSPPPADVKPAG